MNYQALLKKVEDHVNFLFSEHGDTKLFYHNVAHTREVVAATKEIAGHYQLDDHSWFIVCTAAWFHDTGYLVTGPESHELRSAGSAEHFLKSAKVSEEDITGIKKCIMATEMPQVPESLLEKIICDADSFHLGTDNFREKSKLLQKENETAKNIKIHINEWRAITINYLETHKYHTDYCRVLLDNAKADNLSRIKNKLQKALSEINITADLENRDISGEETKNTSAKSAKENNFKKKKQPERGVQTMFRISSTNNVRISRMADNKAHIMISVNSIIISVVLGLIVRNLDENRELLIPTIILLTVNVFTIIFSVLATRPKVSKGFFTQEQVENKSVNLLYFGSFYKMNYPEYNSAVKKMMKDRGFLYENLRKDIFWQGKVLGRKYHFLRISYNIFMYGIIVSVIAFSVATYLAGRF
jgi:predicted metal-dependent HD superfamily phosphohydrolase